MSWIYGVLFALRILYWFFKCSGGCGCELKTKKGEYPEGWHYVPKEGWVCPDCYLP